MGCNKVGSSYFRFLGGCSWGRGESGLVTCDQAGSPGASERLRLVVRSEHVTLAPMDPSSNPKVGVPRDRRWD